MWRPSFGLLWKHPLAWAAYCEQFPVQWLRCLCLCLWDLRRSRGSLNPSGTDRQGQGNARDTLQLGLSSPTETNDTAKKNTNKQQIDTKIFTSKHKVRQYIRYVRGTVWHLYICHVESQCGKKKQICLNMKWKIIEMYLSDLPPAPWNKFPIPCS